MKAKNIPNLVNHFRVTEAIDINPQNLTLLRFVPQATQGKKEHWSPRHGERHAGDHASTRGPSTSSG